MVSGKCGRSGRHGECVHLGDRIFPKNLRLHTTFAQSTDGVRHLLRLGLTEFEDHSAPRTFANHEATLSLKCFLSNKTSSP
jgi:hypothetical protein